MKRRQVDPTEYEVDEEASKRSYRSCALWDRYGWEVREFTRKITSMKIWNPARSPSEVARISSLLHVGRYGCRELKVEDIFSNLRHELPPFDRSEMEGHFYSEGGEHGDTPDD